jgi:hypothetical protein
MKALQRQQEAHPATCSMCHGNRSFQPAGREQSYLCPNCKGVGILAPFQDIPGRKYLGVRDENGFAGVFVWPEGDPIYELPPRNDLRNHSPDGFEWGYVGSGPAQLALALLAHVLGDELALDNYQDYKFDVLVGLPNGEWLITQDSIEAWVEEHMRRGFSC